ncbi:hypothetical protein EJB05_02339, partial [Eragrostis curvula]
MAAGGNNEIPVLALPAPAPAAWPVYFGSMEHRGRMDHMEDTTSIHPGLFTWIDGKVMHFAGVFDGHGGTNVSALCQRQMHVIVAEELAAEAAHFLLRRRWRQLQQAAWVEQEEEAISWRAALRRAFARVDVLAHLACACGEATLPRCACPLSGVVSRYPCVGSTAVVALLVGDRVIVANCGDSRAVLCRGPADAPPLPLSDDHKQPDRPDERARIMSVGGQVLNDIHRTPRVAGLLAMSRALGDRLLRPAVISDPEITITQRTMEDQCLILASDGIWDVMSNETACAFARQALENGNNDYPPEHRCTVAAVSLVAKALQRDSQDNVSAIVVDLQNRAVQSDPALVTMGLCLSKQNSSPAPLAATMAETGMSFIRPNPSAVPFHISCSCALFSTFTWRCWVVTARSTDTAVAAGDVPELTVRELREATGSFSRARLIGKGKGATVYRASLISGRAAAAKRLDLPRSSGGWDAATILRQQIAVVSKLRHQNVVRLLGYTVTVDLGVLLYEFAALGTLHDALHGPRGESRPAGAGPAVCLSWVQRLRIALDTARGLAYMHEAVRPPATHGDVRPTNVLLFEGFRAKIGDYNLFRDTEASYEYDEYCPPRIVLGVHPPVYTAPEIVMRGSHATDKGDVFSFGVVLLELLTGRSRWIDNKVCLLRWAPPLLTEGRIEECIDTKLGDQYCRAGALELGRVATSTTYSGTYSGKKSHGQTSDGNPYLTVLSVFLHLQTQAAMEGSTSVQEPTSRPRKMAVANARNLVCRSCRCIIAIGVQFERCCYSGSELVSCHYMGMLAGEHPVVHIDVRLGLVGRDALFFHSMHATVCSASPGSPLARRRHGPWPMVRLP